MAGVDKAGMNKTGIIVPCWDTLRHDAAAYAKFVDAVSRLESAGGIVVLSGNLTAAAGTILRDHIPQSFVASPAILSPARLARLCTKIYAYDGAALSPLSLPVPQTAKTPRFGYIVSNGFGLGHVTRMKALARGLSAYGPHSYMSYSGGMVGDAFYLPSHQYLHLDAMDGHAYTREATMRYFDYARPTHVFYDGNAMPDGLLAALAAHPRMHLTWVRRGMWQPDVAPRFMALQALADLVIEPGDLSETYDTGPSWQARGAYAQPARFLKTPPVKALQEAHRPRAAAREDLGLSYAGRYALLMLGASQKAEDAAALAQVIEQVRMTGITPVIAHWPISHAEPPRVDGAVTIERMPIAHLYNAFDVIISAAGYNSFHELVAGGHATVFIPQEDEGRDQQLARARYAADNGMAQMVRRFELDRLHDAIAKARAHEGRAVWLEDWDALAAALDVQPGDMATVPFQKQALINPAGVKRLYRGWKKRHRGVYANVFALALNMDAGKALRRLKGMDPKTTIVITDTVPPIVLRRAGYRYLWLNRGMLSPYGFKRQMLAWLRLWRPSAVKNLG